MKSYILYSQPQSGQIDDKIAKPDDQAKPHAERTVQTKACGYPGQRRFQNS